MLKVLIVGQTPPPFGGQAILIERLVSTKLADVELIHVRMAFSSSMNEIGRVRLSKIAHLLVVIVRIVYHRFSDGARILYYPPAGPDRVPMVRDVIVLLTTRWLFDKTVFHFHAGGISELYDGLPRWLRWLYRRAYFNADAAIRLSELTPEDGKLLNAKSEFVIPNGIDDPCPDFNGATHSTATRPSARLKILFVGILRESKGVNVLLEACGLLAARGVPFELELMGQWHSEDFANTVAAQVAELGVSSQVKFLGVLTGPEKFAAFRRADLFCFPSFFNCEAFPVVLLEAMAWGLPIVSTKWRGIPSIVDDGVNGFLVDPHDAVALADQVERLARDVELRQAMGRAGRAKFVREFTHQRCASRMRSAFLRTAGMAVEDHALDRDGTISSFAASIDGISGSSKAFPIGLANEVAADEPASGVLL
jgi:glycosyltransferase involved in cell wall biosynthesis